MQDRKSADKFDYTLRMNFEIANDYAKTRSRWQMAGAFLCGATAMAGSPLAGGVILGLTLFAAHLRGEAIRDYQNDILNQYGENDVLVREPHRAKKKTAPHHSI